MRSQPIMLLQNNEISMSDKLAAVATSSAGEDQSPKPQKYLPFTGSVGAASTVAQSGKYSLRGSPKG